MTHKLHWYRVPLILLLTLLLLCFSTSPTAQAYLLVGFTWPNGVSNLTWNFNYEHSDLWGSWGYSVSDWDGTSTPIGLSYDYSNPNVQAVEYSNEDGYMGNTGLECNIYGDILSADIWLNWFYLGSEGYNGMRSVVGHEWGHAFGLMHVSGTTLMDIYRDRDEYYVPQSDDINGINAMY